MGLWTDDTRNCQTTFFCSQHHIQQRRNRKAHTLPTLLRLIQNPKTLQKKPSINGGPHSSSNPQIIKPSYCLLILISFLPFIPKTHNTHGTLFILHSSLNPILLISQLLFLIFLLTLPNPNPPQNPQIPKPQFSKFPSSGRRSRPTRAPQKQSPKTPQRALRAQKSNLSEKESAPETFHTQTTVRWQQTRSEIPQQPTTVAKVVSFTQFLLALFETQQCR